MKTPFFIEADENTIYKKLKEHGINVNIALPPPCVGATADGAIYEIFMHTKGKQKGYMVHTSRYRMKQSSLKKYFPN